MACRAHLSASGRHRDQDTELQRLLDLGARPADVGQTGDETWHVLADPEGYEFCLLRTRSWVSSRVGPEGSVQGRRSGSAADGDGT